MDKALEALIKKSGIELDYSALEGFREVFQQLIQVKEGLKDEKDIILFNKQLQKLIGETPGIEQSLFPNTIPLNHFALPAPVTDSISQAIGKVDQSKQSIIKLYDAGQSEISLNTSHQLSFKFDDEIQEVKKGSDFFDMIRKIIKDGTVLQHYCALWNFAWSQNSYQFRNIHIDEILETFLKKPKNGYFRQPTRKNFTNSIRHLEKIKIQLPVTSQYKGKRRKTDGFINVPLVDFRLSIENKAGDVITGFIGELFGGNVNNNRGRIFPMGIFVLDSRTEGNRITLAFRIATRFDQLNQKPISWTRKFLIEQAGYQKTNKNNPSRASDHLKDTLLRLKEVGCIVKFSPETFSTDDGEEIQIFSPLETY